MLRIIKHFTKTKTVLLATAVLVAGTGAYTLSVHSPKSSGTIPTLPSANKSVPIFSKQSSPNSSTNTSTGKTSSPNSSSSDGAAVTQPLQAPFGSFVSNHHPSISGSSSPTKELSECNTTSGAVCYLEFARGGVVKKLAPQAVASTGDTSYGVTSWSWDINQAGLTSGTWQVTAVATLNGQTKSTTDNLTLDVQP